MLSRKVVTRSRRGFTGCVPSKKLNRHVQFESLLERDAIELFERADEVLSFREQPMIIYYYIDGVQKKYYPDFELILDSGQIVHIEVKPKIKLRDRETALKYQAINQHYLSRDEHFSVLTEVEIRTMHTFDIYALINNDNLHKTQGSNHAKILF